MSERIRSPYAQPSLLPPTARTSDPATSHAASRAIEPRRGTLMSQVLAMYRAYPEGLTPKEVGKYLMHDGAWKRVSDLKALGLVRTTGAVRDGGEVYVAIDTAASL